MLRFLTAGESHGPALTAIVDGVPSGLSMSTAFINKELARRQLGFGRGGRMDIEQDKVRIFGGVRRGKTIGGPISLVIRNADWENWRDLMAVESSTEHLELEPEPLTTPRPGHADFAGAIKFGMKDIRNVLERASARETAARVAAGAVAKRVLAEVGIEIASNVIAIGPVAAAKRLTHPAQLEEIDLSPVRCLDEAATKRMVETIEAVRDIGDTVGGVFEVLVFGTPPGLGSYTQWDQRLDGRLAQALMSIPAIKEVGVGDGASLAEMSGSQAHDELYYQETLGFYHQTNHAGGLEGGVTNGEPIRLTATMKPIPTLTKPLNSVDMATKQPTEAFKERSDVCAVPSAAVVGEAMAALIVADALTAKFGADSVVEIKRNLKLYREARDS